MIGRRAFALGLGATLAAGPALADVRINGQVTNDRSSEPLKKLPYIPFEDVPNHRAMMRDIVHQLAEYCHRRTPSLLILARNAPELIVEGKREWEWRTWRDPEGAKAGKYGPIGSVEHAYLQDLDGFVFDGIFAGRTDYGQATTTADKTLFLNAAKAARGDGKPVFAIEYGPDKQISRDIADAAKREGFVVWINHLGDERLAGIPKDPPARENPDQIATLGAVRNFLVMLSADGFKSRADWVTALARTNYDALILDPFRQGDDPLTPADIRALRYKRLGTRRLVLAVMPVGHARQGAYYWKPDWKEGAPSFLVAREPDDPSQWVVEYWREDWKKIMGGYIEAVAKSGFDGVLLTDVEAYLPFEDMMPID